VLRASLETLGLSFNLLPELLPQLDEAILVMETYLADLVAERRAGDRLRAAPDLLDGILKARDEGVFTEAEMVSLLIFLFVAGYDTSKNVLTLIMLEMLDRHETYEHCAENVEYARKVVEETFRYHSVSTVPRVVSRDFVYRDVLFPAGQMLFFPLSMAGRDPGAFADADRFDPLRDVQDNRHMAFGRGIHICLGQFIARAQIEEGLHLIAQRVTKPRLAGEFGYRPFPGIWGLRGLPITFTPDA
jgi:cytochrome P450